LFEQGQKEGFWSGLLLFPCPELFVEGYYQVFRYKPIMEFRNMKDCEFCNKYTKEVVNILHTWVPDNVAYLIVEFMCFEVDPRERHAQACTRNISGSWRPIFCCYLHNSNGVEWDDVVFFMEKAIVACREPDPITRDVTDRVINWVQHNLNAGTLCWVQHVGLHPRLTCAPDNKFEGNLYAHLFEEHTWDMFYHFGYGCVTKKMSRLTAFLRGNSMRRFLKGCFREYYDKR
jgi:hypothetical protein